MWFSAAPMASTMPSPTRAMIVSSVAPPTSRSSLVRTVTRAAALQADAVLAHAFEHRLALGRVGAVDDLRIDAGPHGIEDVAAGQVDGGGGPPRQIHAGLVGGDHRGAVFGTLPRARKCASSSAVATLTPACTRAIFCLDDHLVIDLAQLHPQQVQMLISARSARSGSTG